jgi:3-oxoacid CoA-transferase A subunit
MPAIFPSVGAALSDVPDGASIMFGGFISAGSPRGLIKGLVERGTRGIHGIANNIGFGDGLDELCRERQLARMTVSFAIRASAAKPSLFEQQYRAGEVELELVPQGTLAERIRAGGAGIGGFFTRTGVGTVVAEGKQSATLDGCEYLLERPLRADFAFVRATRADRAGNLVFRGASRNFNSVMATAATIVIAEVDEIVENGQIHPETVVTPGILIDRLVLSVRK